MITKVSYRDKIEYRLSAELGSGYRQLHRCNGPARIWDTGAWAWWLHGEWHRYYGPADSTGGWILHSKLIKE